jgi:hypothetical protein
LQVVERLPDRGRGFWVEEAGDRAPTDGGREHEPSTIERARGVAPRQLVVGIEHPTAHRGGEVLHLDRPGDIEQRCFVFLVEVVATLGSAGENLDVGDRQVSGIERLRGLRVAAQEPRALHDPRCRLTDQARLRRQPRHRTEAVDSPGLDRIAVDDRPQHLGVEPLLGRPQLDQPGEASLGRPRRPILRRHRCDTIPELRNIEHAFDATSALPELQGAICEIAP